MQVINMQARLYDPFLGQFISVDPLADKYPGWGAYVYCANNPLKYIDPTGEWHLGSTGGVISSTYTYVMAHGRNISAVKMNN